MSQEVELLDAPTELSPVERAKLENLEIVINQHRAAVLQVAYALRTIHAERLYRATHESFDAYVAARFDFKRAHAYRLIDFADVSDNVSPAGDDPQPNERQARELAKLPAEQQADAWSEATSTAEGSPTAGDVADVVARKLGKKKPKGDRAFDWVAHFEKSADGIQDVLDNVTDGDQLDRFETRLYALAKLARQKAQYEPMLAEGSR